MDVAQQETAEGPGVDTLFDQQTYRLPDMRRECRWPTFTPLAYALGVQSMLSVQLYVEAGDLGVLNLHSDQVDAFNDESEHVALMSRPTPLWR